MRAPAAMVLVVAAALALVVGAPGCSSGPSAQCRTYVGVTCRRAFECYEPAERASAHFREIYGANETECRTRLDALGECAGKDAMPCPDAAQTYSPDKDAACTQEIRRASCELFRTGMYDMASCSAICQ